MKLQIAGFVAALAPLLVGCDGALIVNCDPGRFARIEGEAWCVYESRTATCPTLLPEEHRLDWGGLGCAKDAYETLPSHPCLDRGDCEGPGDGG